jgi:hypothetical protein
MLPVISPHQHLEGSEKSCSEKPWSTLFSLKFYWLLEVLWNFLCFEGQHLLTLPQTYIPCKYIWGIASRWYER